MAQGRILGRFLVVIVTASLSVGTVAAAATSFPADCSTVVEQDWWAQERWVWSRLCQGEEANLETAGVFGLSFDPNNPATFDQRRILRPSFMKSILVREPFRSLLQAEPVIIHGAWVREPLNIQYTRIPRTLFLRSSRFDADVLLTGSQIEGAFGIDGSHAVGSLDLSTATVNGNLFANRAQLAAVELSGASVGRDVVFANTSVTNQLNLIGATVDGNLLANDAKLAGVDMSGASVGQNVALVSSWVTGPLDLNGVTVQGNLFANKATLADVDLIGASIGEDVYVNGSTVTESLNLNTVTVDGNLFARGAKLAGVDVSRALVGENIYLQEGSTITGPLKLNGATVDGSLVLQKTTFGAKVDTDLPANAVPSRVGGSVRLDKVTDVPDLDLSGAVINGELNLCPSEDCKWAHDAVLDLRNAQVGSIADSQESWPDELRLSNFSYKIGRPPEAGPGFGERELKWYEQWLLRDALLRDPLRFTPQPYVHLEQALRTAGRVRVADGIAYARSEAERHVRRGAVRDTFEQLYYVTVGSGHHPEYAGLWVVVLIALGTLVINRGVVDRAKVGSGIAFSIDRLLPLVTLREEHKTVDLHGFKRAYFYCHTIAGYILATFLVAGLTELVQ